MWKKIGLSLLGLLVIVIILAVLVTKHDQKQVDSLLPELEFVASCPPKVIKKGMFSDEQMAVLSASQLASIPLVHQEAFQIALYYYPELSDVDIIINFDDIPTTMQTQPLPGSIFSKKRRYEISINNANDFPGVSFQDISLNAQVGILTHELAHVLDYEHKNGLQIIGTGLKFLRQQSQENYEKSIDKLTVYKGLGYQLKAWAEAAIDESKTTLDYRQFKKDVYLEPVEIQQLIDSSIHPCYFSKSPQENRAVQAH